jgi:uncharacterized delta-60 repeat protein/uncharacterized repeat protein (TIGR01451 family)
MYMRRVREKFLKKLKVEKLKAEISAFCLLLSAFTVLAQPANDNFASAEDISGLNGGLFGSVTNDTTSATAEPGEPSHAGFPANATIWYRWMAPQNGEVQLDTLSSPIGAETVLAVYTGNTLNRLRQVAANDDLFPVAQFNTSSTGFGQTLFQQPFNGPSGLRFNAKVGTTYYFVIGAKFVGGPVTFGWAYHASGVFRFATEDAVTTFTINTNTFPPTFQLVNTPIYKASEWESFATEDASTFQTYYQFGVPGVLVTVTRLAGASGRMLVDFVTEDVATPLPGGMDTPAVAGLDYTPVQGTLVFDDFEMTKRIMISIQPDFFTVQSNRDFAVVLSNARADATESPNLSPPRIDGAYGRAIVRILDADIDPVMARNFQLDPADTNMPPVSPPIFQTTNSIFNFSRVAYRTPEDVNDYWNEVTIWIDRSGTNNEGVTLHYRINNFLGAGDNADLNEEDNNLFPLQPGSDYATPLPTDGANGLNQIGIHGTNADFTVVPPANYGFPGGGTLAWGQNDFRSKSISFVVTNDSLTEFNEDWHVFLYRNDNNGNPFLVGTVNETCVTILFDDQDPPAGSVDQLHNADFGASMVPPVATPGDANRVHPGADSVVYDLAVQPDDKTVIVGDFLSFNATIRNRIARLNVNGSLDTSFNPGSGANDFIGAVALMGSGQFVIGGGFSSYNGTPRVRVARLNGNGSLDNSFSAGDGSDGSVWALAVQPDGKVIIGGEFTSVAGVTRTHIARLNTNGVLDATFDPGPNGPDGTVWAVVLQPDGKVIIGGEFHVIAGQTVGGIARLNADGTLDTSFFPGAGTDGTVYSLALQPDGKVVVGGDFSLLDFNPRNNLTRLNSDGSLDTTFDPGSRGAEGTVYSITVAGGSLYVGGSFLSFNGTHRLGLVRLFPDGTVDTGFLDTSYNQFAGLHRVRFSDPPGIVFAAGIQTDGNVMIAGSFEQVGGGQASSQVRFDPAYPTNTFNVSVWTEPKARDGLRNRRNVARLLGGSTPGPGNISFTAPSHTANENQSSLSVSLTRNNGTLGFLSANFEVEEGLAQSGVDYIYNAVPPIYLTSWRLYMLGFQSSQGNASTRMHSDGLFGDNFVPTDIYGHNWFNYTPGQLVVTILNDNIMQGDRNTTFRLANPTAADQFYLGGENIPLGGALGRSLAPLTIIDDDKKNGVLGFASANFVVNENVTNAVVTIIRTNGSSGSVSCQYATVVGGSATAGVDYQTRSGTLTFNDTQTERTFTIPITDNSVVNPDKTIFLRLTAATGVALGLSNAVVTIIDNDTPGGKLKFSSATFSTNEDAGAAVITVTRNGSSSGTLTVNVAATNGTAIQGVDFIGVTNLLTWPNGDVTPKTMIVPLLDDGAIEPNETVNLRLFGPTLNSSPNPASLSAISNATLIILNADFSGQVSFSAAAYNANENGGPAIITVVRTGGSAESISVHFATSDFEAFAGSDYGATNGTLNFGPGELSKSFTVPIIDNQLTDGNRRLVLTLSGASPSGTLGFPNTVFLTIVDDESVNEPPGGLDTVFVPLGMNNAVFAVAQQSDGELLAGGDFTQANLVPRLRIARLHALDGSVDPTFQASANGTVRGIVPQADGRILIGGAFTAVSSVVRNHIARVNSNGSLDTSFDPGSGTDNPLFAVAESFVNGERKIFIGGGFTVFNGLGRNGIARLNNDGSLDMAFDPGLGAAGVVYALAAYPTNTTHAGKVLIAGDFTAVNGIARGRIARLNSDGSVDLSFNPGTGANDAVRALAIQVDGRILIGGSFTNFNGAALNRFARLNADGSRDATFTPRVGADDTVNSITVQGDTRILLGGQFTRCNGVTRHRITRLNNDGTADPTINFGNGANDFVSATLAQPDGKIVIGGGFTEYDDVPRQRIARIYGGSIAGSGTLEFTAAEYRVDEDGTNALITVRRRGGTSGQTAGASISVDVVTSDGTATNGVNYIGGTHTLVFAEGEVFQSFLIPVINDFEINPDRTVNLTLANISPPGSASLGNQPVATLIIVNDNSAITFASATYTVNKNVAGGVATIQVVRRGSTRDPATVDFTTTTNGTAKAGVNYTPVTNNVVFAPGQTARSVTIPIINNTLIEGNKTVTMELTNAIGALLLVPSQATLTIVDDNFGPGQIAFAPAAYVVAENGGNAVVSLIRSNGWTGVVGVSFYTRDGTANAGFKYTATSGTVSFGDGETNKNILVPILDDTTVEGDETFFVTLTNATGGAAIAGSDTATVTIIDNDQGFSFSSPVYVVNEGGGSVTLTVLRLGGSNGFATVRYSTADVTATAGLNYAGVTNGLLTFANGETFKTFTIPILENTLVQGDVTFNAVLSNPSPGLQLLNNTAVVTILDDDAGLAFAPVSYSVSEGGTNVVLTVVRTNANTGTIGVSFASSNLTATAGVNYTPVAGQLIFTNGEAFKTITIPILEDHQVEGDETFSVTLSNPTGGAQITNVSSTATVTIVDIDAGVRFSSANYSVSEGGVQALITVLRAGVMTNTFAVHYSTSDGTATSGLKYIAVSGTLVFTNGETFKTFTVPIIDDTVVDPALTVLLSLSSPTGQVSLLNPNQATLTIIDNDGGSILPAGTRLTSDPNGNGAIDPNETVTALFALRNVSGSNTANLVATLLAANGVTSPTGPQTYGVLADGGASVSRPFTFTASGTNGSILLATFQVQDGALNLGRVTFGFLLGSATTTFTNPSPITIVDISPASPYPSSITVTGLVGVVSKVTMTVTNLSHGSPSDIEMLLVGPTGTNTVVMSDAGGHNFITNVTLTFDDAAANSLPIASVITNGTYKPTNFGLADQFPSPAPPAPWAATLSAFNGSNPNGLWSLYIVDDLVIFSGSISRGWSVSITAFGLIAAAADLSVTMTAAPDPVVVSSNLTYTIVVTNHGPWEATGIVLSNSLPEGATLVSTNATQGTFAANGALVWTIGTLAKDATATATIIVRPGIAGSAISTSSVLAVQADPNLANNVATTTTTVSAATADLALGVVVTPDVVFIGTGNNLTYSIAVTNLGPATATAVTVTNTLPPTVNFVSATPAGYTLAGSVVTFTNLGNLGGGAQTAANIVVKPTVAGTITNTTTAGSGVLDPFKANNTVLVKTVVEFPQITTTRTGNNLVIAWPADANGYTLEHTASLTPPAVWTPVATAPVRVGNQKTVTLSIGSGNEFFRLRTTAP